MSAVEGTTGPQDSSQERARDAARSYARSLELKARASQVIPGISQTFSKGPTQFPQGVSPVFLERAHGSRVWDVDGNEYVDYLMALGSVILGHAYERVDQAVRKQLSAGVAFSLPHPVEVELAELLVEVVPCAEMVRFAKNGSDATAGAVRAARAITGRDVVVCSGYHGWQDWFIGTTTRARGVPGAVAELTKTFAYNDLESLDSVLEAQAGRVAAVILEPAGVLEPAPGFLEGVVELAHHHGALVVFDEIVTGFRLALGGAQELYGVVPDLACVGKAMGNGYAIAAVVGPVDFMHVFEEIFFSFTFAGDPAASTAAISTIAELRETDALPHIAAQGQRLIDGYAALADELGIANQTTCRGFGARSVISFDTVDIDPLLLKSIFQQEVLANGVLSGGYHNLSFSHGDAEIEITLRAYRAALETIAEAISSPDPRRFLSGELVKPVFRAL